RMLRAGEFFQQRAANAAEEAARLARAVNRAAEADAAWADEREQIEAREQTIAAQRVARENQLARVSKIAAEAIASGDPAKLEAALEEIDGFSARFGEAWGSFFDEV